MTVERITNNAASLLTTTMDASQTTLTVDSATGFPTVGQFRIIVDNELMLVTGLSSTTFTVVRGVEGTTAAGHSSATTVTHIVTAATYQQIRADQPLAGLAPHRTRLARLEMATFNATDVVTLCDISGAGIVTTVWFTTNGASVAHDPVLSVYVDGEATPSVEFDTGCLGSHWGPDTGRWSTAHTSSESVYASGETIVCRFPIPFATELKVTATNTTAANGHCWAQVFYTLDQTSSLRLKSSNLTYLNKTTIASAGNHDFLNLASGNAGVIVWHSLTCANATSDLFLESDINIKIDGEATASISATGTEDWFMGGNYYDGGLAQNDWSYVSVIDRTNHRMNAGLDLLALYGGIRYSDGVVMNWDCTEMTDTSVDIAYLVLYYEEAS